MENESAKVRKFSSAIGENALRFGDGEISLSPALTKEEGGSMSAYASAFQAGAAADLPAPYAEIWVVLSGALRVGTVRDAVTVRAGEFVHVPEQAPGIVEALEDTRLICVSVPGH